ncbi:MAG: DUF721 domain-containing protein [Verrucomicrobia bacterium]|jgi:predicted nucleic acid-binding Zn ribbon protein|nr:DUF721 domain-containing protein [Verrucomicrobiota bacterium]
MDKAQSSNVPKEQNSKRKQRIVKRSASCNKVLREWRRVNCDDQEKLKQFEPNQTSDLVNHALRTLRLDQRTSESQILKAWNHLIDPTLTAHAQPVGIRKGTLFVNVDNSVWLSEIVRYRRQEILERLQSCFGKEMIQRISFRIG